MDNTLTAFIDKWYREFTDTQEHDFGKEFGRDAIDAGLNLDGLAKLQANGQLTAAQTTDLNNLAQSLATITDAPLLADATFGYWHQLTATDGLDVGTPNLRAQFILLFMRLRELAHDLPHQTHEQASITATRGGMLKPENGDTMETTLTLSSTGLVTLSAQAYPDEDAEQLRATLIAEQHARVYLALVRDIQSVPQPMAPDADFVTIDHSDETGIRLTTSMPAEDASEVETKLNRFLAQATGWDDLDIFSVVPYAQNTARHLADMFGDLLKKQFGFDGEAPELTKEFADDMPDGDAAADDDPDAPDDLQLTRFKLSLDESKDELQEMIELNQETATMEYGQKDGDIENVSRLHNELLITDLLDQLSEFDYTVNMDDVEWWNKHVGQAGIPPAQYLLEMEFADGTVRQIGGTYLRPSLPAKWPNILYILYNAISQSAIGDAFNPSRFAFGQRQNERIYVQVQFKDSDRKYDYIADQDLYDEGDHVIVPVGADNTATPATVVGVGYYTEDDEPYPHAKAKHVLGRVKEEK